MHGMGIHHGGQYAQLSEHQNVLAEIGEEELIADYEIPTIDEFIG